MSGEVVRLFFAAGHNQSPCLLSGSRCSSPRPHLLDQRHLHLMVMEVTEEQEMGRCLTQAATPIEAPRDLEEHESIKPSMQQLKKNVKYIREIRRMEIEGTN
ncbi:hypothetical protein ABZP36_021586 [Zizania latifolia]